MNAAHFDQDTTNLCSKWRLKIHAFRGMHLGDLTKQQWLKSYQALRRKYHDSTEARTSQRWEESNGNNGVSIRQNKFSRSIKKDNFTLFTTNLPSHHRHSPLCCRRPKPKIINLGQTYKTQPENSKKLLKNNIPVVNTLNSSPNDLQMRQGHQSDAVRGIYMEDLTKGKCFQEERILGWKSHSFGT